MLKVFAKKLMVFLLLISMLFATQGMTVLAESLQEAKTQSTESQNDIVQEEENNGNNFGSEKINEDDNENEDDKSSNQDHQDSEDQEQDEKEQVENDQNENNQEQDKEENQSDDEATEDTTVETTAETTAETTIETTQETTVESSSTEEQTTTTVEESTVATSEKVEESVATVSEADNSQEELLSSIYANYKDILSYNDGVISLKKDLALDTPITFNDIKDITFDLNGHELTAPSNGFAIDVVNSTITILDKKAEATVKGNKGDSALVHAENSDATFVAIKMYASKDCSVLDYKDSNITLVATTFVGGEATGSNNGASAIVGNISTEEYKLNISLSKVIGGKGGYDSELLTVKSKGGKSIIINDESLNVIMYGRTVSEGIPGDFGGTTGGNAIELTGAVKNENIVINQNSYIMGGEGGSSNKTGSTKTKNNKIKNDDDFKAQEGVFGAVKYEDNNATADEIAEIVSKDKYQTDDKYITSLKNQEDKPWCFTFAHIAMAETYMLKHYWDYCQDHLFNGEFNLSEVATAYFYSHSAEDPLGNAAAGKETNDFFGEWNERGVNDLAVFLNSMSQFRGLYSEESAVFPDDLNNEEKIKSNQYNDIANLTEYNMIGYNENPEYFDLDRDKWINNIKNIVAIDGSCVIDTPWFSEGVKAYGTDGKYNTYVFKDVYSALFGGNDSHALQIIGWDDSFSRDNFVATDIYKEYEKNKDAYINEHLEEIRAAFDSWQHFDKGEDSILVSYTKELLDAMEVTRDGAFLCKNSHGKYTWLSYSNCRFMNFLYTAQFIPSDKYDRLYYYDGGTSPARLEVTEAKISFNSQAEKEKIMGLTISSFDSYNDVIFNVTTSNKDKDGVVHDDYEVQKVTKKVS